MNFKRGDKESPFESALSSFLKKRMLLSQPIASLLSSFDNEESTFASGEQGIISTHPCASGEPCPFVQF